MTKEITGLNFESEVLNCGKSVVVDFWAPWCAPCKAIAPVIEALSEEMKDSVVFGKVNIADHPDIAGRYGIMSIPTLILFKGGNVAGQLVGVLSRDDFKNRINAAFENV